jgi:hypothetical protein
MGRVHLVGRVRQRLFAANLWCAAFVVPKTPDAPEITDETFRRAVDAPERISAELRELVESTTRDFAFLHWHLAFLDAFGPSGGGGFDVVLGNPPWEKVKLSEKEFFAARDPEIAEMAGAKRKARSLASSRTTRRCSPTTNASCGSPTASATSSASRDASHCAVAVTSTPTRSSPR